MQKKKKETNELQKQKGPNRKLEFQQPSTLMLASSLLMHPIYCIQFETADCFNIAP